MVRPFGLAYRLQPLELAVTTLATAAIAVAAAIVVFQLQALAIDDECWQAWLAGSASQLCVDLVSTFNHINESQASPIVAASAVLPWIGGALVGLTLVSREIESGTAATAWALAASRLRWLRVRVLPVVLWLLVLGFVLAASSELLWMTREPWLGTPRFSDSGLHGITLLAKLFAAFGIALSAGAIFGRLLPAALVTALACALILFGIQAWKESWVHAESLKNESAIDMRTYEQADDPFPGGALAAILWRTPDGSLTDYETVVSQVPDAEEPLEWLYEHGYQTILVGVPAASYPAWSDRETAAFAGVGLISIALGCVVVARRRPY